LTAASLMQAVPVLSITLGIELELFKLIVKDSTDILNVASSLLLQLTQNKLRLSAKNKIFFIIELLNSVDYFFFQVFFQIFKVFIILLK
jgi:gamma-glutamyl:cysteine ligase YbdK (ATP-grasp superfamily)